MANKIVQLVDKNSNNLYPVAGAVITDAVSTGAISSQAVTNPKIENGAVNGVENDATAIGTAKLALDTVGTPNLRDASVTSDKIDWPTLGSQYSKQSVAVVATGTTASDITSITVGPGQWLFLGICDANNMVSGTTYNIGDAYLEIFDANTSTRLVANYYNKSNTVTGLYWWTWNTFVIASLTESTTIKLRVATGNASARLQIARGALAAIRVG